MQRPRRTSEFHDDPKYIQRDSRSLQRSNLIPSPASGSGMAAACTAGGTAKQYNTRLSRIAVPTRPSSNDRLTTSAQRGVTPQKTPLPKRVLFTAEKQRQTPVSKSYAAVHLHNDKKWVQEATQRITEHLLNQGKIGEGISTDFLARGLRQMSIKQFIAIINYFLSHIWGNRFTVGSNYVDDILSIMQKLNYPHPLNKSWLKTPNTQHSFGNVVVLLDFLMDFVPNTESSHEGMFFNLKQPSDFHASKFNVDRLEPPDIEFQYQLLITSEKSFLLWDKQNIEEFNKMKETTCNLLLQKVCNVSNLEEMEIEIQKAKEVLKSLEKETPPEDGEMKKQKVQLGRDLKNLNHKIKTRQAKLESIQRNIKQLSTNKIVLTKEVDSLEKEVKTLQETISKQPYTIQQRDLMIENVMQHKQMLAIKERAVQELQDRYENEQILKSKAIKQLNDKIEKFNCHMREIKFSGILKFDNSSLGDENLELSLRPQETDIEKRKAQLERINQLALKTINKNKQKTFQLQEHCKHLKIELDTNLYPQLYTLKETHANLAADLEKLTLSLKNKENELLQSIRNSIEELVAAENTIDELENIIKEKKCQVEKLEQSNEKTMRNAEELHQRRIEQKKSFLSLFDKELEKRNNELDQLIKQVELNGKLLEEIKNECKEDT